MTNEQKAKEISQQWWGCGKQQKITAYESAIEAMAWKDEQHEQEKQQWVDKACKWWENDFIYPTMTQSEIDWYQTKIAEFKQAMKGE